MMTVAGLLIGSHINISPPTQTVDTTPSISKELPTHPSNEVWLSDELRTQSIVSGAGRGMRNRGQERVSG